MADLINWDAALERARKSQKLFPNIPEKQLVMQSIMDGLMDEAVCHRGWEPELVALEAIKAACQMSYQAGHTEGSSSPKGKSDAGQTS